MPSFILNPKEIFKMRHDMLIQNNASGQMFLFQGLVNTSDNELYFEFEDFEMPSKANFGEYTYYIITNNRSDVVYEEKNVPLDTVLHTDDGSVLLKDLSPEIGLLKYLGEGSETKVVIYRDQNKQLIYRKHNG